MVDLQRSMAAYGISFAPGCKEVQEIVIRTLLRTHFPVKNSLSRIRARILFVQFDRDWNRDQYTSCCNRPLFLRSATNSTASSVDRAPNWATISTSARSTSFAIRLASPQI